MNNPTPWPAEAVAILKSEVASRTPYVQIAEVLTDAGFPATRDSVAGKIRRLHLPRYRSEQARKEPFRWSPEEVFMLRQLAKTRPHDALADDLSDAFEREFPAKEVADKMKALGISKPAPSQTAVDLQRFIARNRPKPAEPYQGRRVDFTDPRPTCRWICDEIGSDGIRQFCGEPRHDGVWCAYHAKIIRPKSSQKEGKAA